MFVPAVLFAVFIFGVLLFKGVKFFADGGAVSPALCGFSADDDFGGAEEGRMAVPHDLFTLSTFDSGSAEYHSIGSGFD